GGRARAGPGRRSTSVTSARPPASPFLPPAGTSRSGSATGSSRSSALLPTPRAKHADTVRWHFCPPRPLYSGGEGSGGRGGGLHAALRRTRLQATLPLTPAPSPPEYRGRGEKVTSIPGQVLRSNPTRIPRAGAAPLPGPRNFFSLRETLRKKKRIAGTTQATAACKPSPIQLGIFGLCPVRGAVSCSSSAGPAGK